MKKGGKPSLKVTHNARNKMGQRSTMKKCCHGPLSPGKMAAQSQSKIAPASYKGHKSADN